MKKIVTLILVALLPVLASAYDAEIDGIYYNFSENEATVTYGNSERNSYSGEVIIPELVTYNEITYNVTSIGNSAFCYCESMTGINIPESVTSIGNYAFQMCGGLTGITMPEGVTVIGDKALGGCYFVKDAFINHSTLTSDNNWGATLCEAETNDGLLTEGSTVVFCRPWVTDVVIPDGMTSIGKSAFAERALTSITLPESMANIGDYAFEGCALTSIVLPESVTSIGDYSFANCSEMTGFIIPKSMTSIGYWAFKTCYFKKGAFVNNSGLKSSDNWGATLVDTETDDGLLISGNVIIWCRKWATSITIPQGITSIGDGAFSGCTSLTSVTIPEGVRSIGQAAFSDCTSLTSITIPRSLTRISDLAFRRCESLSAVYISDLSAWCRISISGSPGSSPFAYAQRLFLNGEELSDLVIPDDVKEIGANTFAGWTGLTSVTIPDNVTSIAAIAFAWCTGLTSVSIGNGVTSIGIDAFSGCTGLTSVSIGSGVTSIGRTAFYKCTGLEKAEFASIASLCRISFFDQTANPLSYAHHLYVDGSEVTELVIPEGVTAIGDNIFYGCNSLTSISLPGSITSLGSYSFYGCKGLTDIYCYAEDVPEQKDNTFSGVSISKIFLHVPEGTVDKYKAATSWRSFKIIEIGVEEGIVVDGISYRIYTPVHSKALTADVMAGNNEESEIVIPSTFECEGETYRVTSIGNSAFQNYRNLTSITIPEGVTSIGESAFRGCRNLTSIIIPAGVTSIGERAFDGCSNLTSINIPDGVTSISSYTFNGCRFLTSIVIPDGVTSIGDYTFCDCRSLTSIVIPSGVTSIGRNAFNNCYGMSSIYCLAEGIPVAQGNLSDSQTAKNAILHVPASSVDSYKADPYWGKFKNIVGLTQDEIDGIASPLGETEEGAVYGLDGRRLSAPQKGINIVNGKKVLK